MPGDSTWNTPMFCARLSRSKAAASSSGISSGVDFLAGRLLDQLQRVLDDGERFQAEEIHLEQAEFAERLHRVLGDDAAVVVRGERDVIGQVVVGDDDAGGVDAGLARDALPASCAESITGAGDFLLVVGALEIGAFLERLFQRHLRDRTGSSSPGGRPRRSSGP